MASSLFETPIVLSEAQIIRLLLDAGANRTFRQGANVQADHCPLHGNRSPTLGINTEFPHAWNCYVPSCKRGKDIVSFVQASRKIPNREDAIAWLIDFGATTRSGGVFSFLDKEEVTHERFTVPHSALAAYPPGVYPHGLMYRAIRWWADHRECNWARNFLSSRPADLRLGYDRHAHRLVFPVFHADKVLGGFVGRAMRPKDPMRYCNYDKDHFKKGEVLLGSEEEVDRTQPLITVEGPTDWLNMRCLGFRNVRATLGAKVTQHQVDLMLAYDLQIVPLFDWDKEGHTARKQVRSMIAGRAPLLPFAYPPDSLKEDGTGDPGNFLVDHVGPLRASFSRRISLPPPRQ